MVENDSSHIFHAELLLLAKKSCFPLGGKHNMLSASSRHDTYTDAVLVET